MTALAERRSTIRARRPPPDGPASTTAASRQAVPAWTEHGPVRRTRRRRRAGGRRIRARAAPAARADASVHRAPDAAAPSTGPVAERGGAMSSTDGVRPHPIEVESYRILAERVDLDRWPPASRAVVARVVHAERRHVVRRLARGRRGDLPRRRRRAPSRRPGRVRRRDGGGRQQAGRHPIVPRRGPRPSRHRPRHRTRPHRSRPPRCGRPPTATPRAPCSSSATPRPPCSR